MLTSGFVSEKTILMLIKSTRKGQKSWQNATVNQECIFETVHMFYIAVGSEGEKAIVVDDGLAFL